MLAERLRLVISSALLKKKKKKKPVLLPSILKALRNHLENGNSEKRQYFFSENV